MKEENKRYLYEIREGWSTEYDGNSYHTKDLIANNDDQVVQYLKDNYNLENSDDMSGLDTIEYEHTGLYSVSDHGNLIDANCDKDHTEMLTENNKDEICQDHFYQTDYVQAWKNEHRLTKKEIVELHKNVWTSVIDITQ